MPSVATRSWVCKKSSFFPEGWGFKVDGFIAHTQTLQCEEHSHSVSAETFPLTSAWFVHAAP